MNIKLHFPHSYLDQFPRNLAVASENNASASTNFVKETEAISEHRGTLT